MIYKLKKLIWHSLLLLFITGLFWSGQAQTQNPTESRKEYRKRKKALKDSARYYYYNLDKFDQLLSERDKYAQKNDSLRQYIDELIGEVNRLRSLEGRLSDLERENSRLQRDLLAEKQKKSSPPPVTKTPTDPRKIPAEGTYFCVQVGAYTFNNYSSISRQLRGETLMSEYSGGLYKYIVGLLKDYNSADQLKSRLLSYGLPQAWIVVYQDGQRVPITSIR